jgi:hypothetical protein
MSYALVIVERPEKPESHEACSWDAFPQVDGLTDTDGIFCMGGSAWIFDTTKAIVPFGLLIAQASERSLQLYVFHLLDDSFRLHATSYPRSVRLQQFLDS